MNRLVARSDAVLHSYRPGVPERLGIDFETLRTVNPRLVHLYNGSYGSRGPRAFAAAFHVTGGAVCGGAFAQAGAGVPPPVPLEASERARIARPQPADVRRLPHVRDERVHTAGSTQHLGKRKNPGLVRLA